MPDFRDSTSAASSSLQSDATFLSFNSDVEENETFSDSLVVSSSAVSISTVVSLTSSEYAYTASTLSTASQVSSTEPESRFGPRGPKSLSRHDTLDAILESAEFSRVADIDPTTLKNTVNGFKVHFKLLDHQVLGLAWMSRQEKLTTRCGGILADDMGLGKTIQVIARVIEGKRELLASGQSDGFSTATLIVCPVSLIAQWAAEIRSFTLHPNVIEYHGPRRPRDPDVLASADFVITSYSTLETEHRILTLPRSGKSKTAPLAALFQVKWRRAVLDEAHCIKVSTKKQAVACFHIEAVFRWCVTGTPIQNGVEDMYSYLRFLRIAPFDDRIKFNSHISRPFKSGKTQDALRALHTVLKSVMLRRAKGAVSLPSKTVLIVKCIFDERERALYTSLERELQDDVARALASKKFATVLVSLLRLRQACCHERLVPAHEIKAELLELNEEFSGSPVCTIEECDAELSSLTGGTEREDRHPVVTAHAVSGTKTGRLSAKVRKTIELLREIQARPGSEKTVIFSQFLTMLDVLHEELQAHGFRCVRYDGNMTKSQRDASVREIQLSSRCDCILVSFKAGGVGLNLTSCNNVILTDLWWNPALEEQAFDRTHRLGQVKNVHVYKLVTERSIEDRILALQAKKRLIATRALGSDDVAMSRADVVSLFEKVEAERP